MTNKRDLSGMREPGGDDRAPRHATPVAGVATVSASPSSSRARRVRAEPERTPPAPANTAPTPASPVPTIVVEVGEEFCILKAEVQPDNRGRLTIGQEVVGEQHYRVLRNSAGQILLDPVVSIPTRELWLFQNHAAFASVARGIQQARQGELKDLGSFALYATESEDEGE